MIGGKLYVAGGSGSNRLDIYDPETNRWTTGAPMPSPAVGLAGVVVGSSLYVLGGPNGEVRLYNANTNRWSMRPPLLTPRQYLAAAKVMVNGEPRIVAVGGLTDTGTETEIYTP